MQLREELSIVIPVYNEEVSLPIVIAEWKRELSALGIRYHFIVINDGSRDGSLASIEDTVRQEPDNFTVHTHSNQGHGQSCRVGYLLAEKRKSPWILQIDSDGQCDPKYFNDFWSAKVVGQPLFGFRVSRDDGFSRWVVSRILSLVIWLSTGVWVRDSNVPYRLFDLQTLSSLVRKVPKRFFLANALITTLACKHRSVKWIPIHFRDRHGGSPSLKGFQLILKGKLIFTEFWTYQENDEAPAEEVTR